MPLKVVMQDITNPLRVSCPFCKSINTFIELSKNGFELLRCNSCGLVFAHPIPTKEQLNAFYEKDYWNKIEYNKYEDDIRWFARKNLEWLSKYNLNAHVNLLEIGCSFGFFLDEARKKGFKVKGFEKSKFSADYAIKELGLDVTTGEIEELSNDFIENQYDIVVMLATIEHLTDPFKALQFVSKALKDGGLFLVSTGVMDSFNYKIAGDKWIIINPPEHLFYFSKKTFKRLLMSSGFSICDIRTNSFLVNPLTKSRVLVRLFNNPLLSILGIPLLVKSLRWGDEMFIICRKRV